MSTPNNGGHLVYDTPGRECAHANKGCCPRCLQPVRPFRSYLEKLLKLQQTKKATT